MTFNKHRTASTSGRAKPDYSTHAAAIGLRRLDMLGWALTFLVIALIAALLGFGGIAVAAAGIAKILFVVFLVLFIVTTIAYLIQGRRPPIP